MIVLDAIFYNIARNSGWKDILYLILISNILRSKKFILGDQK